MKSWKSFTSRRFAVDEHLGYRPQWQRGYWDRYIRNEAHYRDAVRYIVNNPLEAGLVGRVEDWPYYAGSVWPGASSSSSMMLFIIDQEVDTPATALQPMIGALAGSVELQLDDVVYYRPGGRHSGR